MSIDNDVLLAIVAVCLKRKEIKKRKKRLWVKNLQIRRNEFTYQHLLDELTLAPKNDFRHFLAYDAAIYEELLQMIGPLIKKQDTLMREAIPVGLRLSTTLRFLAKGDHFENMKFASAMSPNTISKVVLETCEAIIYRLKDYLKLPGKQEEWKNVADDFNDKWNFPNCLGAVTGKYIAIVKPNDKPSLYYNYKRFFSVLLMGVVNANYEFIAVDVDASEVISGKDNFFHTSIGRQVHGNSLKISNFDVFSVTERNLPYVILGDNSFQLTEHFMKPFSEDNLTKEQQIYNERLGRVYQIVENTFGSLFSQFGVLQKPMNLAPEKVKVIVLACCYLYNFIRRKSAHNLWDAIFDKEDLEAGKIIKGSWRDVPESTSLQNRVTKDVNGKAEKVRENFAKFLNKGEIVY